MINHTISAMSTVWKSGSPPITISVLSTSTTVQHNFRADGILWTGVHESWLGSYSQIHSAGWLAALVTSTPPRANSCRVPTWSCSHHGERAVTQLLPDLATPVSAGKHSKIVRRWDYLGDWSTVDWAHCTQTQASLSYEESKPACAPAIAGGQSTYQH